MLQNEIDIIDQRSSNNSFLVKEAVDSLNATKSNITKEISYLKWASRNNNQLASGAWNQAL